MTVKQVLFEPETGDTFSSSSKNPGDLWQIIVENQGVSILDSGSRLLGSGNWSGKGIRQRYEPDDRIDDRTWARIEKAVRATMEGATIDPIPPSSAPYIEFFVELDTGEITARAVEPSGHAPRNAFEWKIVVENNRDVSVIMESNEAFARATWNGDALVDHEVKSRAVRDINDYQWKVVEAGVRRVMTGKAAVIPKKSVEVPTGTVDDSAPVKPRTGNEGRSGWWACAAAGIAIVATLIAWRTMPRDDTFSLVITIVLGVIALGLLIYGLYGLTTRCPSCKAWYRRNTTSTVVTGQSTYSKQISKAVTDASGKQIGTTYETATYERTSYRYHYECGECGHRWTGTGSSERRIS